MQGVVSGRRTTDGVFWSKWSATNGDCVACCKIPPALPSSLSLSLSLSQAASVYSCSACAGVYTLYSDTLLLHSQVREFGPKKVQMSAAGKRIPNLIVIPGVHPAGFYEWLFSKGLAHLFDCITIVS
jgi:hypothetical protein